MVSTQIGPGPAKLSFAKVAAMRAPANPPTHSSSSEEKTHRSTDISSPKVTHSSAVRSPVSPQHAGKRTAAEQVEPPSPAEYVTNAIEGLSLVQATSKSSSPTHGVENGDSLEDDQSHLSNSSLKQQSFDTKSMASVTTFAMDEKESIRPDDSASVRAADDDDGPIAPSREHSFHRDHYPLMPAGRGGLKANAPAVTIAARKYHTLTLSNPPRFGDLPAPEIVHPEDVEPLAQIDRPLERGNEHHDRSTTLPVAPDEKLLDALATPKDRLPLLQLEEKFLAFVTESQSSFVDLPPQNSFTRLLAHKLADYYSLAHRINEDGHSIRLFKTPGESLPTPLHVLALSIPVGTIQAPSAMAVKIMRRALGPRQSSAAASTAASSSVPSKATSEAGLETNSEEGVVSSHEGTPNKDKAKPTREEREAQYKAARERIFGDFQESVTSESASTGENSASMSRSSSSSGKRKGRKSKVPKDDTFEARSAFVASYTPMHGQGLQQQYQQHYPDPTYHNTYPAPANGYGPGMNFGTTPTQSFPGFDQNMGYQNTMGYGPTGNQHFNPADSWSPVPSSSNGYFPGYGPNGYQQGVAPMMNQMNNGQFMPHQGMQQPGNWMNAQFQNSYQQPPVPNTSGINNWSGYGMGQNMQNAPGYAYGQLPSQGYGGNPPFNAHPVPGSYSRSLFNPQTRSFVPGNPSGRTGSRNNRKKPTPPMQSGSNNGPKPFGSDSSGTSTLSSPRTADSAQAMPPKPKEDSLQQKYGAPAHLPKKPPPSQIPSTYDVESINHSMQSTGPLLVNGGSLPNNGS